jgi:prepilin-type N-terminal cleavage/methylation domain-containing protein
MKNTKGFTLIEMAVVLAVIAVLAAILTPLVTSYIDQARVVRANADTNQIAKSYILYYRDTAYWPVYTSLTLAQAGNPSVQCQVSGTGSRTLPTQAAGNTTWSTAPLACNVVTNVGIIREYLNVNTLGLTTGNPAGGGTSYRGPYLDGLDAADPWGNLYVVNSRHLSTNDQTKWAFAISAGPDGLLSTSGTQQRATGTPVPVATSGDDILSLIR